MTIWGRWGHSGAFAQFFLQKILDNIGTMWWCTILNKNTSVAIHNTIYIGKKLFFQMFFVCFGIDFYTFIVHKKQIRSTFHVTQAETITFFQLPIGVMKKAIILNIIFFFKSIVTTVL